MCKQAACVCLGVGCPCGSEEWRPESVPIQLLGCGKEAIDLPFVFIFLPRKEYDFILIFSIWIASSKSL